MANPRTPPTVIYERLAQRHAREQRRRDRNAGAREAIRHGAPRGFVMLEYGLSTTAFEQLFGQERVRLTGGSTR